MCVDDGRSPVHFQVHFEVCLDRSGVDVCDDFFFSYDVGCRAPLCLSLACFACLLALLACLLAGLLAGLSG